MGSFLNKVTFGLIVLVLINSSFTIKNHLKSNDGCNNVDFLNHPKNLVYANYLKEYVSKTKAPGSILAIKIESENLWVGSSGKSNLDDNSEMLPCTQFRTGSITKAFTAVVIMKLVEQNKLALNTTITEVLPKLDGKISNAHLISIKQLLNHSSGLRHPTDDNINYQLALINNSEFIGSLNAQKRLEKYIYGKSLKVQPGNGSYYSNSGYWVLQLMAEKVTGKPLQALMNEFIFQPFGLINTYLDKRDDSKVSRGYNFLGNRLTDVASWDRADSDGDPAAGIISTAEDLVKFTEALFSERIVSKASLDEMKITTRFSNCPNQDCGYGLGIESWNTAEYKGFGKNGSSAGVDANLIYFPAKKTTIVLFSNYGGGNQKSIIDKILQ